MIIHFADAAVNSFAECRTDAVFGFLDKERSLMGGDIGNFLDLASSKLLVCRWGTRSLFEKSSAKTLVKEFLFDFL